MTKADSTQRTMKKARKSAARTKATGKRNAGRTAKAASAMPRSPRQWAAAIIARNKRNPKFWGNVVEEVSKLTASSLALANEKTMYQPTQNGH